MDFSDAKFHQWVRLTSFEKDRIIRFILPDGEFELNFLSFGYDFQKVVHGWGRSRSWSSMWRWAFFFKAKCITTWGANSFKCLAICFPHRLNYQMELWILFQKKTLWYRMEGVNLTESYGPGSFQPLNYLISEVSLSQVYHETWGLSN